LDAKREVAKRLKFVIAGWYELLTLFRVVAKEDRIVADQYNHGDAVAELPKDLVDEASVGLVEAEVNCGERFVRRREVPCFGEFTLRVRVRELH
jgi:hypothetical protein